jgi:DNA uptake protein ComE-like DNA-binding protein
MWNLNAWHRAAALLATTLLLAQPATAQVGRNDGLIDPNLASVETLTRLPEVDAEVAAAIVKARPIRSALALDAALAPVLEAAERQALYARLFRQIDLNAASEEEILLIPGMSKRMAHEFEEYRPYRSLEQFRREIGKYVDAAEVARLESYVTLDTPAQ